MLWRWAFRELWRDRRLTLFFIFNLALGLTGFITIEAYKKALEDHLARNQKLILGADLAVGARRALTEDELAKIHTVLGDAPETVVYDFFAMVTTDKMSRLVLVKAIDERYPLYGKLGTADEKLVPRAGEIWVYPELAHQLGIKLGDPMKLGNLTLTLRGLVTLDNTQTFRAAGIAPRVFVHRDQLDASGLIQTGSTFTKSHLFQLPPTLPPEKIKDALFDVLTDNAIRVDTPVSEGEDAGRQLNYLSDFLALVAMVALFLAALGGAYIWRLFLQRRLKDVAILRSLGLQAGRAIQLSILEAVLLGVGSLIPAVIVAQALLPALNALLGSLTSFDLNPVLSWPSIAVGLLLAVGTSLFVALPFLLKLRDVKPARLFNEEKFEDRIEIERPWALLPAVAAFWGLAVWQSKSYVTGSLFCGALAAVLVLLAALGWVLLWLLRQVKGGAWDVRHGLRSAGRRPTASLAVFLSLGLGSLLINLLPQIKTSIQSEMTFDGTSKVPSLFMFDIQDEQLSGIEKLVVDEKVKLTGLSPLIRARLLKVNGVDYERKLETGGFKTREAEREARFRNRGINLSFRSHVSESEEIIEGQPFDGRWVESSGRKPGLSVEWRYADRMGFKIGDLIVLDVQGVEIEGEIVNLRKVKWTSFQPNFFMTIQDGVLDDAPKTWIAGISQMPEEQREALQTRLSREFPNVSAVDVGRTVKDVLQVAEQMSWSLELMAALAVVTGGVVLFSIARSQVRSRRWELNLLKVLGASPGRVRRYLLVEFAVLAGLSSLLGSGLSLVVSAILMRWVFEAPLTPNLPWALGTWLCVTLLGLLVATLASNSVVREKALTLLRE